MSSPTATQEPPVAAPAAGAQRMNIVIVGHVDHGKSTVIGRLLADTHSLPEGKLEQVRANCEMNSKPFEYAFLLDALKDEQAQGITIDAARVFFKSDLRHYLILDAPGHIEFLKNMITGAARAEAALLVIDAAEGVQENSRRHGYMMSLLGIKQLAVVVNKMDLVGWDRAVFDRIVKEYGAFLDQVGIKPACFIPVSARGGDNIADRSAHLPWYQGPTVLNALDQFKNEPAPVERAFRMPVQDVYKFTKQGDDRRIVSGTIDSGAVNVGDTVIFYPSGKKSRVKSIEAFNRAHAESGRGGLGGRLHAAGADLHHPRRDGGAGEPDPPAGHHPAPGQPLLARQRADGQAEGVSPQAGHRPGHLPGRGSAPGDGRLHARHRRTAERRFSGTTWPSACCGSTARSPATSPRTWPRPAASSSWTTSRSAAAASSARR